MSKKIDDGLNKWQRYRLKNLPLYRKRKREYAKTEAQRIKRNSYMKIWKEKNRDRVNELARQSHARNRWKHKDKLREKHLLKNYGITQSQYETLLKKQNGACMICQTTTSRRLHVDHSHTTGVVRGLLCSKCNGALGWYEKYENNIRTYLKK